MATKKKLTFEEGMAQLEQLVNRLEKGEMPLEESFKAYEQGVTLTSTLKGMLDEGEKRIAELTESGETLFEEER